MIDRERYLSMTKQAQVLSLAVAASTTCLGRYRRSIWN